MALRSLIAMNPADLFRQDDNPVILAPGDSLFAEGDPGTEMFVLLEGSVNVVIKNRVIENLGVGSLIGEMALIDESPRAASVVATTPCRLARINLRRFHFLVQQNPFFASHVMKVLVERIRRMNQQLVAK